MIKNLLITYFDSNDETFLLTRDCCWLVISPCFFETEKEEEEMKSQVKQK